MNSKTGLEKKTILSIRSVLDNYKQIEKIILYGSRAKGTYQEGSDIDLTLIAPALSTEHLLKIETELDDLMLPYKIDLSLYHQIENPNLIEHIQKVGLDFHTQI